MSDPPAFSTRTAHRFVAAWAAHHPVMVLESCDGTGKTTLATILATGYGYRLSHANRSPDDVDLAAHHAGSPPIPARVVVAPPDHRQHRFEPGPQLVGRDPWGWPSLAAHGLQPTPTSS